MNISRRVFVGSAASLAAAALAGCAGQTLQQDEQALLTGIQDACQLVPIGSTLAAVLLSSIPTLAPVAPIVQTISTDVVADCQAFVSAIEAAVGVINNSGGTATVTVSSTTTTPAAAAPAAKAAKAIARRAAARFKGAAVTRTTTNSITIVIPPQL